MPYSPSDTYLWINTAGGAWALASNWSDLTSGANPSSTTPGPSATATIDGPSSGSTLDVIGPGTANTLTIGGSVDISGALMVGTLSLTQPSAALFLNPGTVAATIGTLVETGTSDGLYSVGGSSQVTVDALGPVTGLMQAGGGGVFDLPGSVVVNGGTLKIYGQDSGGIEIGSTIAAANYSLGVALQEIVIYAGETLSGSGVLSAGYDLLSSNLTVEGAVDVYGTLDSSGFTVLSTLGGAYGTVDVLAGGYFTAAISIDQPSYLTIKIENGASAHLPSGGLDNTETIDFAGTDGILSLYTDYGVESFGDIENTPPSGVDSIAQIEGFAPGDRLIGVVEHEGGVASSVYTPVGAGGTLVLTGIDGVEVGTIALDGTYSAADILVTMLPNLSSEDFLYSFEFQVDDQPATAYSSSAGSGAAHTFSYIGPSGGAWSAAANWSDVTASAAATVAPGPGDTAIVNGATGGAFTVLTQAGSPGTVQAANNVAIDGTLAAGAVLLMASSMVVVPAGGSLKAASLDTGSSDLVEAFGNYPTGVAGTINVTGGATIGAGDVLVAANGGRIQVGDLTLLGGDGTTNTVQIDPISGVYNSGAFSNAQNGSAITVGTANDATSGEVMIDAGAVLADFSPASNQTRVAAPSVDDGTIIAGDLWTESLTGTGVARVSQGGIFDTSLLATTADIAFTIDAGGQLNVEPAGQLASGSVLWSGVNAGLSIAGNGVFPNPTVTIAMNGFAVGDSVQLEFSAATALSAPYTQTSFSGGTVSVLDPSDNVLGSFNLQGNYAGDPFVATNVDGYDTNIVLAESGTFATSAGTAAGNSFSYTGPSGGAWGDPANWTETGSSGTQIAPGANDVVTVAGGASNGLTVLTGSGMSANLATTGNVAIAGTVTTAGFTLGSGTIDADLFIDEGGTLDARSFTIGATALPTVVVDGPGAVLNVAGAVSGTFVLGEFYGLGGFTIENGGSLAFGGYSVPYASLGEASGALPFLADNNATIQLPTSLPADMSLTLSGTNDTLTFVTPAATTLSILPTITGFADGDVIDVTFATSVASVAPTLAAGGVLDLLNSSGTTVGTLTFAGSYAGHTFNSRAISASTTQIVLDTAEPDTVVITAPGSAALGAGVTGAIGGIRISDIGTSTGQNFTVTLSSVGGTLTATGAVVSGSGTKSVTIAGSLAQVDAAVATLADTEPVASTDTITVTAADSLGTNAKPASVAVTAAGVATVAGALTVGGAVAGQTVAASGTLAPFSGVTISDPNAGATDTVTITLSAPGNGTLSNVGTGGYTATTGVYTVAGSASAVQSAVDALVFTPTTSATPLNGSTTTGFTIAVSDGLAAPATNGTTSVIASRTTGALPNVSPFFTPAVYAVLQASLASLTPSGAPPNVISVAAGGSAGAFVAGTLNAVVVTSAGGGAAASQPAGFAAGYVLGAATSLQDTIGGAMLVGTTANATLIGGASDTLFGGNAGETLFATTGAETLYGGTGTNLIELGSASADAFTQGTDIVIGSTQAATITSAGNTTYFGGAGATTFNVSAGSATIVGGSNETINAGAASMLAFGGAGAFDFVGGSGASTVVSGVGSSATVSGGSTGMLYFGNGASTYNPGTAVDTILGFTGSLTATGGANGTLIFTGTAGGSDVSTGTGSSTIFGFGVADTITATGSGNAVVGATAAAETVNGAGSSGTNAFFAFAPNDVLIGGSGPNALESALGNQTLISGSGSTLFEILGGTPDRSITIGNFNSAADFVQLQGYAAGAAATALASATITGGSEILTLSDGTQITFQAVSGLSASSFV